jgi:hypothetical protein
VENLRKDGSRIQQDVPEGADQIEKRLTDMLQAWDDLRAKVDYLCIIKCSIIVVCCFSSRMNVKLFSTNHFVYIDFFPNFEISCHGHWTWKDNYHQMN